jgi:hypothetical protein
MYETWVSAPEQQQKNHQLRIFAGHLPGPGQQPQPPEEPFIAQHNVVQLLSWPKKELAAP